MHACCDHRGVHWDDQRVCDQVATDLAKQRLIRQKQQGVANPKDSKLPMLGGCCHLHQAASIAREASKVQHHHLASSCQPEFKLGMETNINIPEVINHYDWKGGEMRADVVNGVNRFSTRSSGASTVLLWSGKWTEQREGMMRRKKKAYAAMTLAMCVCVCVTVFREPWHWLFWQELVHTNAVASSVNDHSWGTQQSSFSQIQDSLSLVPF